MKISKEDLKELKELTHYNNHNESRHLLAVRLEHHGLIKAYEHIMDLHKYFGHMPYHLGEFRRNDLDAKLFALAKDKIDNFEEVYRCF